MLSINREQIDKGEFLNGYCFTLNKTPFNYLDKEKVKRNQTTKLNPITEKVTFFNYG